MNRQQKGIRRVVGLSCQSKDTAPVVVLRGAGLTADAILDSGAARTRRLPVVRNEQLLDQLFRAPLDAPIDPSLYELVAILLVHVFSVDADAFPGSADAKESW